MADFIWDREGDMGQSWESYFAQMEDDTHEPPLLGRTTLPADEPLIGISRILDVITFGLLPFILVRLLRNLLSAATFSVDIFDEVSMYIAESDYTRSSLLGKFDKIITQEASNIVNVENFPSTLKTVTILLYLLYSVSMSGYIVMTFLFYFVCFWLTTSRRWGSLHKFLITVIKGRNGVI